MNKRKKVAWQKHRITRKKLRIKRKLAAAGGGAAPAAARPAPTT
jgi:hypothetical protein